MLRRHPVVVAAALLFVALVIALPLLARWGVQRALGDALGVPVTIGAVWWNPFSGQATARSVSIGSGDDRMTAQRVAAVVDAMRLWGGGDVVVERVELDAPVATISIDEQYRVTLGVLGSGPASSSATHHVSVHELVVSDGQLIVRHPIRGTVRTSLLRISHLNADGVDLESTPSGARLQMSGRFDGSIDGAPLDGETHVRLAGDDVQITGTLGISGLTVNRDVVPLPPELETFAATVDAKAKFDLSGQPLGGTMRVDLSMANLRLTGREETEVSAKKASLHDIQVNLSSRSVDLGAVSVEAPGLVVASTPDGIVLPLQPAPGAGGQSWAVRSGAIQMRGGRIAARRGDATVVLTLDSARWDGLRPDHRSGFSAKARAESGGVIGVEGSVGADPLDAQLDVRLDELSLPPLTQLAAESPLRLSKGTADGTLKVSFKNGLERVEGRLQAHDVHTAPPDADRPTEVMAVHAAEIDLSVVTQPGLAIDVSLLKLSYPYVMIRRQTDGVFPYSLIAASAPPTPAAASLADTRLRSRVRRLEVEGGKIELVDATQQPPYWTSLTDVTAVAEEILPSEGTVASFEASAKQDELSPVEISGTLTADGLVARISAQDVLLESMNIYVSPVLGYNFTAGRVSVVATAMPAPPLIQSSIEIILRGVDVLQTGRDVIQQQSGVPLPIALGLISNSSGEIRMTVPFFVDLKARSVEVGSVIWQSVRRAILGALTSPLRLLGSLFGTGGAPYAFAIDPVPFRSGSGSLDAAGEKRIAEIARILEAHRGLLLVLMPQITEDDVREVGPDKTAMLAAERTAAVRQAFIDTAQVAAERILTVEWKPSARAEATGRASVYIELQDAG